MPQITVSNLTKTFRVARRRPGFFGSVAGLVKRDYRTVRALDKVSFDIHRGELVGYIGPNGAGKSTTIKILSGILLPDEGTCLVDGRVPWKDRIEHVRRIGVVFGQRTQLWWDLPVIESFDLLRDIYSMPARSYTATREELVSRLALQPFLDVPVRQLSLGERMRCELAASLLHEPSLLFLDEPTIGLDAISKLALRDFILELNRDRKVTIILSTHDMDDIEALCRRLIVIANGRTVFDGILPDLRARLGGERWLTLDLVDHTDRVQDPDAVVRSREGHRVRLSYNPEKIATSELVSRIMANYQVRDLFVENPPIEEIVARLYAAQAGQEP